MVFMKHSSTGEAALAIIFFIFSSKRKIIHISCLCILQISGSLTLTNNLIYHSKLCSHILLTFSCSSLEFKIANQSSFLKLSNTLINDLPKNPIREKPNPPPISHSPLEICTPSIQSPSEIPKDIVREDSGTAIAGSRSRGSRRYRCPPT